MYFFISIDQVKKRKKNELICHMDYYGYFKRNNSPSLFALQYTVTFLSETDFAFTRINPHNPIGRFDSYAFWPICNYFVLIFKLRYITDSQCEVNYTIGLSS